MIIQRTARITESGELILDSPLPKGLSGIEAEVTISLPAEETEVVDEQLWTDEEIAEMMRPDPKTGAEIVALGHTGGWEDMGITDGQAWVEEQRRKRKERREW